MRTWVIKPGFRGNDWPDDLMCFEVPGDHPGEYTLVWIQHDGRCQVDSIWNGFPTAHMFDVFGEKDG